MNPHSRICSPLHHHSATGPRTSKATVYRVRRGCRSSLPQASRLGFVHPARITRLVSVRDAQPAMDQAAGFRGSPQPHGGQPGPPEQGNRSPDHRRDATHCRASASCRRAASLAYADEDVPLGEGRVLIEPAVIARLVQLAAIATGERALVVAAGTGYGAALLAACGARVTALEDSASLQAIARSVLAELAPSVSLVAGPLAAGMAGRRAVRRDPHRGCGAGDIPPAIGGQLHQETGRLVAVCSTDGRICQAMLAESTPAGLRLAPMFDCCMPIPSLQRSPGFVF